MALESGLDKHRIRSELFIEIDANKAVDFREKLLKDSYATNIFDELYSL